MATISRLIEVPEHRQRHDDLHDAGDQHNQRQLHQRIDGVLSARLGLLDLGRIVLDEEVDGLFEKPREERRPGNEIEVLGAHHRHVVDHAAQCLAEPEQQAIADKGPDDRFAPGVGLHQCRSAARTDMAPQRRRWRRGAQCRQPQRAASVPLSSSGRINVRHRRHHLGPAGVKLFALGPCVAAALEGILARTGPCGGLGVHRHGNPELKKPQRS